MAKIAISLPDDMLEAIERDRKARGESRSQFLRRAAEEVLRRNEVRDKVRQYILGYQQHPETPEEAAMARSTARPALAEAPWEDSGRP